MSSNRSRIAVVVLSLCIVGIVTAPGVAQSRREDDGRNQRPERLWRLYPLDPEAGQKDRAPGAKIDTQETAPPVSTDRERSQGSEKASRDHDRTGSSTMTLIIALTVLCLSFLIVLVAWRARRPAPAPRHGLQESEAVVGKYDRVERPQPRESSGSPPVQRPAKTRLVRVHLRDGRVVEGEVKHAATQERPVLLLDVFDVSDAKGQKTDPEPFDAFVPLAQVEHIETIGEAHAAVSNLTERRR